MTKLKALKEACENRLRVLNKKMLFQYSPTIGLLSSIAFLLSVILLHSSVAFAKQQESPFGTERETHVNSAFKFKISYPSTILTNKTSEDHLDYFYFKDFKTKVCIYVSSDFVLYSPKEGGFSSVSEDEKRKLETQQINNINFRLNYFVHYEGMGQWTEGINAFAEHTDKYYVLTFTHQFQGLPQSVSEKEEIKKMRLSQLKEKKEESTEIFWSMLNSFEFTE